MARQLYSVAAHTGGTANLAAGAPIFSLRWADPGYSFRLLALRAGVALTSINGAASYQDYEVFVARSFTASDTGGAAITSFTRRSLDGQITSKLTDMRIAGTAALSAGTRTLETNPFCGFGASFPNKSVSMPMSPHTTLWSAPIAQVSELTSRPGEGVALSANEGIVITVGGVGDTGTTLIVWVQLDWTETPLVT